MTDAFFLGLLAALCEPSAAAALTKVHALSATVGAFANLVDRRFVVQVLDSVSTAGQCSLHCLADTDCMSFFYNWQTGACQLHGVVFLSPEDGEVQRDTKYFQMYAEECPKQTSYVYNRRLSFCFRSTLDRKTLVPAQAVCESEGGHLAEPDTGDKQMLLQSFMKASSVWKQRTNYRIGLQSTDSLTSWRWLVDGSPVPKLFFWAPGKPVTDPSRTCASVSLNEDFLWNNIPCGVTMGYVCEREVNAP